MRSAGLATGYDGSQLERPTPIQDLVYCPLARHTAPSMHTRPLASGKADRLLHPSVELVRIWRLVNLAHSGTHAALIIVSSRL